jgi:siroheme synthase
VKALQALKSCHIVLCDTDLPEKLVASVKSRVGARAMKYIPKSSPYRDSQLSWSVANSLVLSYLSRGYIVVRIKREDLFEEELKEEWQYFAEAGYRVEVIPVISAAAAETYRDISKQALSLVTRRNKASTPDMKSPASLAPSPIRVATSRVTHYA